MKRALALCTLTIAITLGAISAFAQNDATAVATETTTNAAPAGPVVAPPANLAPPPPSAVTNTPSPAPFTADSQMPSSQAAPDATPSAPAASAPAAPPVSTLNPSATSPANANAANVPDNEIDDIRPPFFYIRSLLWLWITLASIAVIALLFFLWKWLKPHRQLSAKSAYELALEKLEKARAMLKEEDPEPYAVYVSETIRSYLGQRFHNPSTRLTTDEFLRLMDSNPNTPLAAHRDLLREFLQSCDLVKFARYQPALSELEQVQQRAYTFVTATRPIANTGNAEQN